MNDTKIEGFDTRSLAEPIGHLRTRLKKLWDADYANDVAYYTNITLLSMADEIIARVRNDVWEREDRMEAHRQEPHVPGTCYMCGLPIDSPLHFCPQDPYGKIEIEE